VLVLALGLALRWTTPSQAGDLRPRPDALEYEEAARNWLGGDGYCLIIDGARYPPRYPFGFSAMLMPVLALMDHGPGTGVLVVIVTAADAIASAWALSSTASGTVPAAVAALLLALSPAHVRLSRAVMSDVPASCLVGWLAVTAMVAAKRHAPAIAWGVIGLLTGLAATVRVTDVLFLIGAGVVLLFSPRRTRNLVALGGGACIGIMPLLAWNAVRFGSPFSDGYHVWRGALFSLTVQAPPAGGGTDPNVVHYARALAGLGDLYPWPIAALVALGLIEGARRPGSVRMLCALTVAFAVPLVVLQTFFFWQDTRFLLPAVPLLCAVAAVPFGRGEPVGVRVSALALGVLGVGLLVLTAGTYPPAENLHEPATLTAIAARVEPNAAILVRTNGPFFRRLVRQQGTDRVWVPLGFDEHQLAVRAFHLTAHARACWRAVDRHWARRSLQRGQRRGDGPSPDDLRPAGLPFDAARLPGPIPTPAAPGAQRPVHPRASWRGAAPPHPRYRSFLKERRATAFPAGAATTFPAVTCGASA
jgi:hypothetical protein